MTPEKTESPTARNFHLGDILSIVHGALVSPRHVEGLYDILDFMEGRPHWTHQLPDAMRRCQPELLRQHPELSAILDDEVNPANWESWLHACVAKFGETLPVVAFRLGHR